MKEQIMNEKTKKISIQEFSSMSEFINHIQTAEIAPVFNPKFLSSNKSGSGFSKTSSFDEAVNLAVNGWTEMSSQLTEKLNMAENSVEVKKMTKQFLSVCGYQAVVPLFLNGVPTNMINKKFVPMKQKVITINKSICYSSAVTTDTIFEESIKALQIVKKIESQGYRVNLNVICFAEDFKGNIFGLKVNIKKSNEKLNLSKMSFPLVHPSMLRRLEFRWLETNQNATKEIVSGYGKPVNDNFTLKKYLPNEYIIPPILDEDMTAENILNSLN